jgi:hypothetical protein
MNYRHAIFDAVKKDYPLSHQGYCSVVYPLQDHKVAKLFLATSSEYEAKKELNKLKILSTLDDRLNVPAPIDDIIELGPVPKLAELDRLKGHLSEHNVFAVVMERIYGPDLRGADPSLLREYRKSLHDNYGAFIEYSICKPDFGKDNFICQNGSNKVWFVDTHNVRIDTICEEKLQDYRRILLV